MAKLALRYSPTELAQMVELFFPDERRHEFTTEPWDGVSFRHYRDPKIVCLEHYRPPDKPLLIGRNRLLDSSAVRGTLMRPALRRCFDQPLTGDTAGGVDRR